MVAHIQYLPSLGAVTAIKTAPRLFTPSLLFVAMAGVCLTWRFPAAYRIIRFGTLHSLVYITATVSIMDATHPFVRRRMLVEENTTRLPLNGTLA